MSSKEYHRKYYLEHKVEILEKLKKWREENPDKPKQYSKTWKNRNDKRNKEINKSWKENNKDKVRIGNMKTYLSFCKSDEYELIENYEQAKADNFKGWDCHHRLELHPDCSLRFTRKSLQKLDLYLNRPASELIFLTHSEHARIHNISKKEYND
jgi:hypothetical protein